MENINSVIQRIVLLLVICTFPILIFSQSYVSNVVVVPFPDFSIYPNGTISPEYNAGPGMAIDKDAITSEDAKMIVISATDETTFVAYIESLIDNGFTQLATNRIEKNIFYTLMKNDVLYYLYFTGNKNQVRIIQDKATRTLLTDLDVTAQGDGKTEFYLYSLDYTHGEGQTSLIDYWKIDCGALLIIKLKDNSLFIVDSGHERQSSKTAMEGLLKFMYEITEQTEGSILNIRGWFYSHAHGDHVYMTYPFLEKYHELINVESVVFNFPSYQVMKSGYDAGTFLMKQTFNKYYPNCKFAKLHTGQSFVLQGILFRILHTHEDAIDENGNTLITDFNDTSTILEITIDGKKSMLLGDAGSFCQKNLLAIYTYATLRSDIVQTAHHGFNDLKDLYKTISAPIALFCSTTENVNLTSTRYKNVKEAASNVKVLFSDPDTYKLTVENGRVKAEAIPSYRSYFKTVAFPDLSLNGTIVSDGNKANLTQVLRENSLADEIIDKSVVGTPGKKAEPGSLTLDGTTSTKFCTDSTSATIAWTMKNPVTLKWYVMYTANDNAKFPGRNPQKWALFGSNDGTSWNCIDSVNNGRLPDTNFTGTAFSIATPVSYQYYAIKIFSTAGANVMQLSEIGLFGDVNKPTGIAGVSSETNIPFTLHSNSNNQVIINYSGDLNIETSLSILNLMGHTIISRKIATKDTVINLPCAGFYLVVVNNAKNNFVRKISLS